MFSNGEQKNSESYRSGKNVSDLGSQFLSFEKLNWYVYLQYVHGEIDICKQLIKRETERSNNRNEFAVFIEGEIYRKEGKLQEALDSFQTYLKINSVNADCLKEVAKCLYDTGRYKLAVEAYMQAEEKLDKNPDWQVYYYLGQCLMKLGDMNRAKEYANKAVKAGKHEMCYSFLVKILTTEGDFVSAVGVANSAVEFCPDSVKMLTECGLLHLKIGQIQQAVEKISSALALDSTYKKALLAIGFITQKHGEYDASLVKYKMAIQLEPDSVALWNNIGLCFYSKQKYIAAISCLKRALWLQPLNWKTLHNLSLAYLGTLQAASAFTFACASVNLRSDTADSFNLLGAALFELSDATNAAKAICRAAELSTSDAVTVVNAALSCYNADMPEEAIEYLKKFQDLISKEPEASWLTAEVIYVRNLLAIKLKDFGFIDNPNSSSPTVQDQERQLVETERTLEDDEV